MNRFFAVLAISSACTIPAASAQETPAQQRQENRETRQEARQEARQEVRAQTQQNNAQTPRQEVREDRRDARQQRAQQRLDNRTPYYTNDSWTKLDPWITRNNVTPAQRVARAAGAAVGATEKALNTATNIADRANVQANAQTNVRYGYANPNGPGQAGWFYDYYTYSPTYYNAPATGATVYGSATRYYDLNNDGVYDSLNVFRDSDSNASYDVYDRYDFADLDKAAEGKGQSAEELLDSPEDANRHTVTGKVYASKTAKVNGNENLIVRLSEAEAKGDSKEAHIIDIGPVATWKQHPLQVNDSITATGPVERVGDKLILIAETVKVGEAKETVISRSAPKMEGQVVDVTETEVKGKQHMLAVIETENSRQLVDLGPVDSLKVKLEPQTKIVVTGVPVQVRNHSIVQAERVSINGQDIAIRRW